MNKFISILPTLFVYASTALATTEATTDISSLSLLELMSVEVTTAAKVSEKIRDTPASVYLVGRSDIERQGHSSLTEIFENVPSFYNVDSYNGVSGNFGIRGFLNPRSQNSSVAILVNGIRQTGLAERSTPMETLNIPVEAIDRIEIIRGPNAVLYGNGASFGAINIITNESFHKNQYAHTQGTQGIQRDSLRWSEASENAHIVVNAMIRSGDGYDYKLKDLMGESGADEFQRLFDFKLPEDQSFKDRLEQEQKYLQLSAGLHGFTFDFTYNDSHSEYFYVAPSVEDGTIRKSENSRATLKYEKTLSENLNFSNQLSYSKHSIHENYDALFPGFLGLRNLDFYAWTYESVLSYNPTKRLNILSGFERQSMFDLYELTHVPPRETENEVVQKKGRTNHSFFTQINAQITNKLRAILGVRSEIQQPYTREYYKNIVENPNPTSSRTIKRTSNTTPRFSLIYQPNKSQVFKFMAGDSIKRVNNLDRRIKDEEYRTIEANYVYSQNNMLISASLFRNEMNNLLVENLLVDKNGSDATYNSSNGDITTKGIELLVKNDWSEQLSTEWGITWQDSANKTLSTDQVSYSPEIVSNAKINYQSGTFSASLLTRYVGSMYPQYTEIQSVDDRILSTGGYHGDRVPSYFTTDISARFDEIWNSLYLSLQIINLFDQTIRYPNNSLNADILNRGLLGNERGARITCGIEF